METEYEKRKQLRNQIHDSIKQDSEYPVNSDETTFEFTGPESGILWVETILDSWDNIQQARKLWKEQYPEYEQFLFVRISIFADGFNPYKHRKNSSFTAFSVSMPDFSLDMLHESASLAIVPIGIYDPNV